MGKIIAFIIIFNTSIYANSVDLRSTNKLQPSDYLYGSYGALGDPVFEVASKF